MPDVGLWIVSLVSVKDRGEQLVLAMPGHDKETAEQVAEAVVGETIGEYKVDDSVRLSDLLHKSPMSINFIEGLLGIELHRVYMLKGAFIVPMSENVM